MTIGPLSFVSFDKFSNVHGEFCPHLLASMKSKKVSNDQELVQSEPKSCPQNQNGK